MNAFVITECAELPIKRVSVNATVQHEIADFIGEQKNQFVNGATRIDFNGSYNVDLGEIFRISNYPIDQQIIDALENPLTLELLDLNDETVKIKALFVGKWTSNERFICFQVMDSRRLLSRNWFALLFAGDTYTRLNNPGIILQDRLTALYENQELLFYSYHNTRRVLDLSEYYAEATNADLEVFCGHDAILVDDVDLFKSISDYIIRKKIALLQRNNVLDNLNLNNLKASANEFSVLIDIIDNKIRMPDNRKELKDLVKFLDEDFFTTPITGRKCVTNSKQYL